ncbi:unnamed protein product [Durusdinium trenchii]|uniref:Uncharacterized protein n=1 Tax=Durusdinium trenchii TaxID=1381693 RepID=A0ABP0QI31_9DINO
MVTRWWQQMEQPSKFSFAPKHTWSSALLLEVERSAKRVKLVGRNVEGLSKRGGWQKRGPIGLQPDRRFFRGLLCTVVPECFGVLSTLLDNQK